VVKNHHRDRSSQHHPRARGLKAPVPSVLRKNGAEEFTLDSWFALTKILVCIILDDMNWTVAVKESVIEDLRWFGKKDGRTLLREVASRLGDDPTTENRNVKTLRPNPVAQREIRLFGKYRALFNLDEEAREVTIVLVGEKRDNSLIVRGEEFTAHHESNPPE
jgi:mRNA-degrading endonuclease RelE of RelBE toxin-antitoxin system